MKLSDMSIDTMAELTKRILSITKKENYAMAQNHALVVKLETTATNYMAVFDKLSFSGLGKQVAEADDIRDKTFMAFRDNVNSLAKMPGLSTQQTAIAIQQILKQHGNDLHKLSYGDQSSHLDKLLEALNASENQTKIATLNLSECYLLLKNAQQAFNALYHKQVEANAELRSKLSASSMLKHLTADVRNYLNYAHAMGNVDETWKALSLELDEVVKAAKNSRLQRDTELVNDEVKQSISI